MKVMTIKMSRRDVLLRAVQIPLGGVLLSGLGACGGNTGNAERQIAACADPDAMDESEHGIRAAVNYVEQSTDPKQVCAGCAFFHAGAPKSACGACDMFTGGPVNSQGHCNSWNAKS